MPFFDKKLSGVKLVIASAIFLAAFDNIAFFRNVLRVYPLNSHNLAFLCSLPVVLVALLCFVLALICSRRTIKPALVFMFMLAAGAGYFMDHYNIIIDVDMVQNISQASFNEALDLLSPKLFLYLFFLGVLPSVGVIMAPVEADRLRTELLGRLRLVTFSLLLVVAPILLLSRFYAPFFREHKELRYYTNPVTTIYSVSKFTARRLRSGPVLVKSVVRDTNKSPK